MKKYIDKNKICVNETELLCDDYIVICKDKGSDKLEILGNVNIEEMAKMIMPLGEFILSEL